MITNTLIGRRLRQRRRILGLTQRERIGASFQQIHKYETGEAHIAAVRLAEIAEALDVGVGCFFEDSEMGRAA